MTQSPESSQHKSEEVAPVEHRRLSGSPLNFDEWVALLVAFGVLGGIFLWSLRPAGQTGGWLSGLGDNSAGLLQGEAAGKLQGSGKDLAANLGLGTAGGGAGALGETPAGEKTVVIEKEVEVPSGDRPNFGAGGAGLAAGAAGAGLAAAGVAAQAPAVTAEPVPAATPEVPAVPATTALPAATTPAATTPAAATPAEPLVVATEAPETSVPEVPKDSWLYPFATSLKEGDRLGELPTTKTFDINAPVTRAEFASLVSQGQQVEGDAAQAAGQFKDLSAEFWAAPRISGALKTGFMSGYGKLADGSQIFGPTEEIPRYQVLVAIASGLKLSPPDNADEILSKYDTQGMPAWAKGKVAAALAEGLVVNPTDQTKLDPLRPTTRGEATAMLQQALQRQGKVKPVESKVTVN
ncbi:MAG: hypothetical protein HC857_04300 [Synechococcales cyanobacterium RU_4_20]|nr:hypothetical protein [Synechococcales cyanobacterium RU_4_20]